MSIEKALADLTEALNANTAALLKAAGSAATATAAAAPAAEAAAPATEKKGPGRPKKEAAEAAAPAASAKPTVTQEQMVAALEEVKDKISLDAAKKIINDVGGVDKRKDIPADKYAAVYEAAKAAVEGDDDNDM